jgi:hypothetical protein
MTIAEQIYLLVKTLPGEQADEVLTFAEFVCAKHQNAAQPTDHPTSQCKSSASFKDSLKHLYDLTQDFPSADSVALVREGRGALSDRGGF